MQGYPEDFKVDIYGDGSYTSPTVWWAALGGFGIWMPKWPSPSQVSQEDTTGPSQQPKPQPPHLPQLDQSSSSSWDPTGDGVNTSHRDNTREGFFSVMSGMPIELGSDKVDRGTVLSCTYRREDFFSVFGVPPPPVGGQPSLSNPLGPCPPSTPSPLHLLLTLVAFEAYPLESPSSSCNRKRSPSISKSWTCSDTNSR